MRHPIIENPSLPQAFVEEHLSYFNTVVIDEIDDADIPHICKILKEGGVLITKNQIEDNRCLVPIKSIHKKRAYIKSPIESIVLGNTNGKIVKQNRSKSTLIFPKTFYIDNMPPIEGHIRLTDSIGCKFRPAIAGGHSGRRIMYPVPYVMMMSYLGGKDIDLKNIKNAMKDIQYEEKYVSEVVKQAQYKLLIDITYHKLSYVTSAPILYDMFLKILYEITKYQGRKADKHSNKLIKRFEDTYSLSADRMKKIYKGISNDWISFNDLFTRDLLSRDFRPPAMNGMISAMSDSYMSIGNNVVDVKGTKFLVEHTKKTLGLNNNLTIITFRMEPQDYHHFCAPVGLTIVKQEVKKSKTPKLLSVDAGAVDTTSPKLNALIVNDRVILKCVSSKYEFFIVLIGATMCGRIYLHDKTTYALGEDMGYFGVGASTILLVLPERGVDFALPEFKGEIFVMYRQSLGKFSKK